MNKTCKLGLICLLTLALFVSGCGPGQAFGPTLTLVSTSTPTPTSTNTSIPPTLTSTPTPEPTATNTPEPTATITLDATSLSKYFFMIGLATEDGVTASTQFKSQGLYCVRHAAKSQVANVQEAIFNPSVGQYVMEKSGIFDGKDLGVVQRGDRSSCTSLPKMDPGNYEIEIWVADVLIARLPFEIVN